MGTVNLKDYNALILCAGSGERIKKLTTDPKCLLKINKSTILQRNIKILKSKGIKNFSFVVGYKKEKIVNLIKKKFIKNIKYKFYNNLNFKNFGNAYSLYLGIKKNRKNILIIDGDLVFQKEILDNITNMTKGGLLVGYGNINDEECAKTLIDKNGFIKKTIDKRHLSSFEKKKYIFDGEAIGIIILQKKDVLKLIKTCKKFFYFKKNLILNWEKLINKYLETNKLFSYKIKKIYKWVEIDTYNDYCKAIKLFRKI